MPSIAIDSASYYYELHGAGSPLVLVSGYSGDHTQWGDVLDALAREHRVLIFDNRGIGQTKDGGEPLTAEAMADDTVALARSLGMETFNVVGQSMGGTIAQALAWRHPDAVDRLILSATSPHWSSAVLMAFATSLTLLEEGTHVELVFDVVAPWCYGPNFLDDAEKMAQCKRETLAAPFPPTLENLRRQCGVLKTFDSTDFLQKIAAPTLILTGTQDIISTERDAQKLLRGIDGAVHHNIEAGHALPIEAPDAWAEQILAFLAR